MMRRGVIRAVFALAVGLAACRPTARDRGGPLSIDVSLSTNGVPVGTAVDLAVTAYHDAGTRLNMVEPGSHRVLVLGRSERESSVRGGRLRTDMRYRILSFDVGTHAVFTGSVRAVTADGRVVSDVRPEAALRIVSLLSDPKAGPRDIRGPVRLPPVVPRWAWALPLVALIALAAALAAVWLWRRPRAPQAPPPARPAHERALAELARVRAEPWIERGEAEPLFVAVSRIVRDYIEERFRLRAPELTTEEFIRLASNAPELDGPSRIRVGDFLASCDLVKFARHHPDADGMRAALDAAERFVRDTIPGPVLPSGEGAS